MVWQHASICSPIAASIRSGVTCEAGGGGRFAESSSAESGVARKAGGGGRFAESSSAESGVARKAGGGGRFAESAVLFPRTVFPGVSGVSGVSSMLITQYYLFIFRAY
ncbi:MAG: hypothetical protein COW05_06610 [Gammaproteobacteria bacterium CG12_big_fil_rev_8_21_14_0_65_46_12]|nr:MAG: hypothetical protein COW05_06610 [Gammaproteobacteria bacterium CG12_big_fil_rev_8_21_14_0_65_46_12]